jgi:hypothetical protein
MMSDPSGNWSIPYHQPLIDGEASPQALLDERESYYNEDVYAYLERQKQTNNQTNNGCTDDIMEMNTCFVESAQTTTHVGASERQEETIIGSGYWSVYRSTTVTVSPTNAMLWYDLTSRTFNGSLGSSFWRIGPGFVQSGFNLPFGISISLIAERDTYSTAGGIALEVDKEVSEEDNYTKESIEVGYGIKNEKPLDTIGILVIYLISAGAMSPSPVIVPSD